MRPKTISITFAAADADGVCQSQTPAAGGVQNLTINGALATSGVATMDIPRHLVLTAAGNESARTFTVYGTDRFGHSISEELAGPNAGTVVSTKNFKTVTQVTTDGNTAAAITFGTNNSFESQWVPVDRKATTSCAITTTSSAFYSATIQSTMTNVLAFNSAGLREYDANVDPTVHGELKSFESPVAAVRAKLWDFTSGS